MINIYFVEKNTRLILDCAEEWQIHRYGCAQKKKKPYSYGT